jgi:hypothetical protein
MAFSLCNYIKKVEKLLSLLMTRFQFKKMDIQWQQDHQAQELGGWLFWRKHLLK